VPGRHEDTVDVQRMRSGYVEVGTGNVVLEGGSPDTNGHGTQRPWLVAILPLDAEAPDFADRRRTSESSGKNIASGQVLDRSVAGQRADPRPAQEAPVMDRAAT